MAMEPVFKPNGEITAPVNGMFVGKSVYVFGKIAKDANRIRVNLMCGGDVGADDVALQLNPRFPSNEVIRNTRINGVWGEEDKTGGFPFKQGDYFSFKITCTQDHFVIGANDDASFATYKHRLPFTTITHVNVAQQCEAILLTSEIDGAEIPALTLNKPTLGDHLIPFYNVAERKIEIVGIPTDANGRIDINLMTEDHQIIFHYNPRLNEKQIVRNTKTFGGWGSEERSLDFDFPFHKTVPFQTTITIKENEFVVDINGVQAFTYTNRVQGGIALIRNLQLGSDFQLERITYY